MFTTLALGSTLLPCIAYTFLCAVPGWGATSVASLPRSRSCHQLHTNLSGEKKLFRMCVHVGKRVGGRKAKRIRELVED